jgi:hypothetical protein
MIGKGMKTRRILSEKFPCRSFLCHLRCASPPQDGQKIVFGQWLQAWLKDSVSLNSRYLPVNDQEQGPPGNECGNGRHEN